MGCTPQELVYMCAQRPVPRLARAALQRVAATASGSVQQLVKQCAGAVCG